MMTQTEIQKGDSKQQYWACQINGWKNSGISQNKYCQKYNLNKHTFKYWKYKLDKPRQNQKQKALLPVSVHSGPEVVPKASSSSGLSITFKDRFAIRFDEEFSSKTLHQVIKVLEKL